MIAVFLDLETTGLDPMLHAPIDLAFRIVDLSAKKDLTFYQTIIKQSVQVWGNCDPISMEINGYQWEEIENGKSCVRVREDVITLFSQCKVQRGSAVFICQNPAFDRAFFAHIVPVYTQESLSWPYHWLDLASMFFANLVRERKAVNLPLPEEINLSKNAIAEKYQIPKEAEPHKAANGVEHLIQCYHAVMQA